MTQKTHTRPARPERLSFRFAREGDRLALKIRMRGREGRFSSLAALVVLAVFSLALLKGPVLQGRTVYAVLFAIPCWTGTMVFLGIVLRRFFGWEYLLLDQRGAVFGRKVFFRYARRDTPLEEVRRFLEYSESADEGDLPDEIFGVDMRTLGRPLRMAMGITPEEQAWLLDQLNGHLASLLAEKKSVSWEEKPPARASLASRRNRRWFRKRPQEISLADHEIHRTSDCRWTRDDSLGAIVFAARDRVPWASLSGMLAVNLFWSSGVLFFLHTLVLGEPVKIEGAARWVILVFLIPFEVIGLILFVGLVIATCRPFHFRRWMVGTQDIQESETWFGFGPRRIWFVSRLDRLEIDRGEVSLLARLLRGKMPGWNTDDETQLSCRLVLLDSDDNELCSLGRLTEGEARWIGDVILRERPEWFGRS